MCLFGFRFIYTIGFFILLGIYYYKKQRERIATMMEKFEGPPLLPFIGNGLMFIGSPTSMLILIKISL